MNSSHSDAQEATRALDKGWHLATTFSFVPQTTLSHYYDALDESRIDDALDLLDPDVQFVMVLPAGTRRGRGRDEMRTYLSGRSVPNRAHAVLRQSRDDDVEFVYGKVTEGPTTTGRFLSGARLGADGLIASYEVTFDAEHVLVEN